MDRRYFEFPVVNDLSIDGMGEIEGHYQPVRKKGFENAAIGQARTALLHYAYEDDVGWCERHKRYAHWEAGMTRCDAWPQDPVLWREMIKKRLSSSVLCPYIMFLYSYIVKFGFLDGIGGYEFALSRKKYCYLIQKSLK